MVPGGRTCSSGCPDEKGGGTSVASPIRGEGSRCRTGAIRTRSGGSFNIGSKRPG